MEEIIEEIYQTGETVHPSIIWDKTDETIEFVRNKLPNHFKQYILNDHPNSFLFMQLPEDEFNDLYDITEVQGFEHHIIRGIVESE